MKTLVCQLWKRRNVSDEEWAVTSYSLHLNEMHRLHFLSKNIGNEHQLDLQEYYPCKVEDDIYKNVVQKQAKHGLMFKEDSFPKRETNPEKVKWALDFKNLSISVEVEVNKKKASFSQKWIVWDSVRQRYTNSWNQADG